MRQFALCAFFSAFVVVSSFAQQPSSTTANASSQPLLFESDINWSNFELELSDEDSDWTFHNDQKSHTLFIDFENLGGNMSRLFLKHAETHEIVASDNQLYDLPINTIYELNLSNIAAGNYYIELHTYSTVIKESVLVQ